MGGECLPSVYGQKLCHPQPGGKAHRLRPFHLGDDQHGTRKPADLLTLHGGSITDYVCQKDCPIAKPGRIKVEEQQVLDEYKIRYSDIDLNGHVNSVKYIEHILDLFPMEWFRQKTVKRFEVAYVAESYYGDTLSFYRQQISENEFDIEVKKNGQEVVVRSKVIFN